MPPLTRAVNDHANLLSSGQREELEKYLREVDKTSKVQVALLIIPSLEGEALEDYSIRVVETWKLGDEDSDTGALLLIAKEDKKIRIEVGYGLEKDLTDALSSKIITNIITPAFKKNDYYNGIKDGLKAIVAYSLKDKTLIKQSEAIIDKNNDKPPTWLIFASMVMFFIITSIGRSLGGRIRRRFGSYRSGSSSYKDRSSNNSFSGKGGRFGGGGASGGW